MDLPAAVDPLAASIALDVPLLDNAAQHEAATRPPSDEQRRRIHVSNLRASGTNPRKHFAGIDELAASITKVGLLQPLVVRGNDDEGYEVICGERRLRAAKLVEGLHELECSVRVLTDADVEELQAIENVQRKDLLPLEEAESYAALLRRGYSTETLAARVSKSASHVSARVRLLALGPEARSLLADGVLPVSVAVPLSRRTHDAQAAILASLTAGLAPGAVISVQRWVSAIQEHDRPLKAPPFDPKAELAGAPPCADCPKNSVNCPRSLFEDYSADATPKAGICGDVACFTAKTEEAFAAKVQKYVAAGAKLLDADALRKVRPFGVLAGGYVDADATCYADAKEQRTWAQLVKGAPEEKAPALLLAQDADGKVLRIYSQAEATRAAAANGHTWAMRAQTPTAGERKASREKAKSAGQKGIARRVVADLAFAQVVGAMTKEGPNVADTLAMVDRVTHELGDFDTSATYAGPLGVPASLKKLDEGQLGAALFAAVMFGECVEDSGAMGTYSPALLAVCKRYGVDLKKIEAAQELATKAEAEKKKKKTKTTKA